MITAAEFLKWLEVFGVQYGSNVIPIPVPISYGGTGVTSVTIVPTATMWAGWDANRNLSANNFLSGYTTTLTAAALTTLAVGSTYSQFFTGTTTQTVRMPVVTTLVLGQSYFITNNSTGVVTVQSSGANTIQAMAPNTTLLLTCVAVTGTTAASWSADYNAQNSLGSFLPLAGGTMSGAINMGSQAITSLLNPVNPQDAMTLNYAGATYLALAGGTMTGSINLGNTFKVFNAIDPTNPQDYATKNYVDKTALNGTSVYAATTTNLNVTQAGAGVGATLTDASGTFAVLTLDGVAVPLGTNVLVKNLAAPQHEGIYTLTTNGDTISIPYQLTRATSYDTPIEINNTGLIVVQNGSTLVGTAWYNVATITTVDTTNFSYSEFGNIVFPISPVHGGTGLSSTTINQILYSSANNIIAGLATADNGVLSTGASGIPVISSTLPSGLTIPGYAASGANADITSMTGLTGYLSAPLGFKDSSGNIGFQMFYEASAVNYLILFNSSTGNPITFSTAGSDSAIPLNFSAKGGLYNFYDGTQAVSGKIRIQNASGFFTGLTVASGQVASIDFSLPGADAATANLPLSSNGSGVLSFSDTPFLGAATATSINFGGSTLSTYHQGTWTPVLTSSGGGTATYNVQNGEYTQTGNIVYFSLFLNLTGLPSAGILTITGLPVSAVGYGACSVTCGSLGATAVTQIQAYVPTGTTSIELFKYAAGSQSQLTVGDCTASSQFIISGFYFTS